MSWHRTFGGEELQALEQAHAAPAAKSSKDAIRRQRAAVQRLNRGVAVSPSPNGSRSQQDADSGFGSDERWKSVQVQSLERFVSQRRPAGLSTSPRPLAAGARESPAANQMSGPPLVDCPVAQEAANWSKSLMEPHPTSPRVPASSPWVSQGRSPSLLSTHSVRAKRGSLRAASPSLRAASPIASTASSRRRPHPAAAQQAAREPQQGVRSPPPAVRGKVFERLHRSSSVGGLRCDSGPSVVHFQVSHSSGGTMTPPGSDLQGDSPRGFPARERGCAPSCRPAHFG